MIKSHFDLIKGAGLTACLSMSSTKGKPVKLEIEFDLTHDLVAIATPYSHAQFSDTDTGRTMLFRALRAVAHYEAAKERAVTRGDCNLGKDIAKAILAYDAEQLARRFDEAGHLVINLKELEIEL